MYKEIRVSGFRGADDVRLDWLGRLNILVGRNNTGKSSCLEAVSLLASGPRRFADAFGRSSLEAILGRRAGGDWKHLVHHGRKRASVEGVLDSGAAEKLQIACSWQDMEEPPAGELGAARGGAYACFRGREQVLGRLSADGAASETAPPAGTGAAGPSLFMERAELIQEELYERTARSGRMGGVVSRLDNRTQDIAGIRRAGGEICVFFKDGRSMPLHLTGDGFRAAVLLSMASCLLEKGTLAVEEPENHMHPALLYHVVDEMIAGCADSGTQMFLATQSDDMAEYALMRAPDEYVSVFHLTKIDGKTYVESFDFKEAREHRLELGLDVRGM